MISLERKKGIQSTVAEAVESLGLAGQTICVHASLRSLNPRIPAGDLIESFLCAGCTLLVPTFTYYLEIPPPPGDRPVRNGMKYEPQGNCTGEVYDCWGNDLSLAEMGTFPAAILAEKSRIRGAHPLNSFAAIGSRASELISGQTGEDVYAPLRKLVELGGSVLLLGTDLTSLTLIHLAEQLSGRRLFIRWANDEKGEPARVRTGSCSRAFNNLLPDVEPLITEVELNRSRWRAIPARETLDTMVAAIRQKPDITCCNDPECLRCPDAVAGGPPDLTTG